MTSETKSVIKSQAEEVIQAEVEYSAKAKEIEEMEKKEKKPPLEDNEVAQAEKEVADNALKINQRMSQEMKSSMMSMNPEQVQMKTKIKRIPSYAPPLLKKWERMPSFVTTLKTTIVETLQNGEADCPIEITFTKDEDSSVAEVSWEGNVFGHMHVGKYSYDKDITKRNGGVIKMKILHEGGPHFIPLEMTKKERDEKFGGHISPWKNTRPANIAVKFIFEKLLTEKISVEPPHPKDEEGRLVFEFADNMRTDVGETTY